MMDVAMSLNFTHYCAKKKKDKTSFFGEEIDLPTKKKELLKLTEAIRPDYDECCYVAKLYSLSCAKEKKDTQKLRLRN